MLRAMWSILGIAAFALAMLAAPTPVMAGPEDSPYRYGADP